MEVEQLMVRIGILEAEVEQLQRVLSLATVDMWLEGDEIMMQVGDEQEPFLYERADVMPELAAYLSPSPAPVPGSGEEGE